MKKLPTGYGRETKVESFYFSLIDNLQLNYNWNRYFKRSLTRPIDHMYTYLICKQSSKIENF